MDMETREKVGIVTLYRDNFGSILQCYATYSYIESLGYQCAIIERPKESAVRKLFKIPKHFFKLLTQKDYLKGKLEAKRQFQYDSGLLSEQTRQKMDQFIADQFEICHCANMRELHRMGSSFYKVIAGSDQIWNVSNGIDDFHFLGFVESQKRIALAPSFGTSHIPEAVEPSLKKKLAIFSRLSAREQSGAAIIRNLTGKNAVRLPDPTILLSKEDWVEFSKTGIQEKDYILVHFLNEPNDIAIQTINQYLENHNLRCICIVNNYASYNRLLHHEFLDIGPRDYVSLIDHAALVFTDSFHSTLFSLNLETEFLSFDRQYSHANSQKTRLTELLERCDKSGRFIQSTQQGLEMLGEKHNWTSDGLFSDERIVIQTYIQDELQRNISK